MRIFLVIPVYNESRNITKVIAKIGNFIEKIILVNDGSTDNTKEVLNSLKSAAPIQVLEHEINLGKGAALKTGCEAAYQLGAEMIICMDGDGQHRPEDLPRFIKKIEEGCDIVYGSRYIGRAMPLMMFLGNKFLSWIICRLFHVYIHDTQSGFRAFTREAYEKIRGESPDYAGETEMIVRAAENKLKYQEIDIDTIYFDNYKGTTPIHGLQIFSKILKWKFL